MIKTKITEKDKKEAYKSGKKIIRICDICGKEDSIKIDSYFRCKKYRRLNRDLCASCSMIEYRKKNPMPVGEKHGKWKGGMNKGYKLFYFRDKDGKARHMPEHRYIYADFLKRELLESEKIHHIDMDTINNNIDNLYLFDSESRHQFAHNSMERTGFNLLNSKIWFDEENCIYVLSEREYKKSYKIYFDKKNKIKIRYRKKTPYAFIYVPEEKKERLFHIYISEQILRRKLFRDECVHHIDGNTLNNNENNLKVMTMGKHMLCHKSLQTCVAELYKRGIIGFDREDGKYFIVEK